MKRFMNILMYAGDEDSDATTVDRAVEIAKNSGGKLTVLDVVPSPPKSIGLLTDVTDVAELEEFVIKHREEQLKELTKPHAAAGVVIEVRVAVGTPVIEVIRQVLRNGHDLLIKSAEGDGLLRKHLFGTTGMGLVRKCPCPVWILKPGQPRRFRRILAAVDAETADAAHAELNRPILEIAQSLARQQRAELHIVYAWNLWMETVLRGRSQMRPEDVDELLEQQRAASQKAFDQLLQSCKIDGDRAKRHLIKGNAGDVIPELVTSEAIELLVMGTVCRTGVSGFLIGNTAERILHDVDCSLLTLKPRGFATPVRLDE